MIATRLRTRCALVRKRGSVCERRFARREAELAELKVVADRDDDVAVGRRDRLVRHDVRVRIAVAQRRLAGDQVVLRLVRERRHLAVEQGHVDVLAAPFAAAPHQRGEDGDRGVHAGHQVRDRNADLLLATARHVIGVSGDAHQAARPLDHEVVASVRAERAILAKPGDRAPDDVSSVRFI